MMVQERTVLVFGATGQQGGAVATALREAGWQIRAFVRDPQSDAAQALAVAGCTLACGDMADRGSVEAAINGVYGVFSVQPSSGQSVHGVTDADEIAYATQIAEAAQHAGVCHFVYSSAAASGRSPTGMGHFDSKTAVEAHLASLTMPSTVVRPTTFLEILVQPGLGLNEKCLTFFAHPDQTVQFIAVADIGRIVAAIFAQPGRFIGQSFDIASDAVTGQALAASLSKAAGERIGYRRFPHAVLADNASLRGIAALFDDGRLAGHADLDALRHLVRDLYTLDRWLAGPGKQPLLKALRAEGGEVGLR
jgi:uncharacterized protein YbjT (DUF2867 family)